MAGVTRLELATSCVTGRRSNQLSYTPISYGGHRFDPCMTHQKFAPFVQWLGHQIFTLETGVQFPYGVPLWSHSSVGRAPALQAGVIGSSPIVTTIGNGGVAQLVRAPACHAGGREFEPRHSRHSSI